MKKSHTDSLEGGGGASAYFANGFRRTDDDDVILSSLKLSIIKVHNKTGLLPSSTKFVAISRPLLDHFQVFKNSFVQFSTG